MWAEPGSVVFLNGAWLAPEQAQISPFDRGFMFGDGVYELVPVYARHPFRLAEHLRRLQHSLAAIGLVVPWSQAELEAWVLELIARQPFAQQSVYLQITRGPAVRDQAFPAQVQPTLFMMASPLPTPSAALVAQGVRAVTAEDIRWHRCDIKGLSLLANVLLRQHSVAQGAAETVLLRDGWLTEGSVSNIFVVKNGVLAAPPPSQWMLSGITYEVVWALAEQLGLPYEQRAIAAAELWAADELLLTSSSREIQAIVQLDDRLIGTGRPGPVQQQLYQAYQHAKQQWQSGVSHG